MDKQPDTSQTISADFTILFYLRFFIYVYCAYKIVDIVFLRRQKIKARDKVERKIIHAHGPVIVDSLSQEDKRLLQLTIQNTFQNATQPLAAHGKKSTIGTSKKVSFMVESNIYYDPEDSPTTEKALYQSAIPVMDE